MRVTVLAPALWPLRLQLNSSRESKMPKKAKKDRDGLHRRPNTPDGIYYFYFPAEMADGASGQPARGIIPKPARLGKPN
jgi:hypothetical protein